MTPRLALACVAFGLGGCATTLESTLPATATGVPIIGVPTAAVPFAALDAELTRLQRELERRVAGRDWGVPLQLSRGAEASLRVRVGADESFDTGTAQLQIGILQLYAEIAAIVRTAPAVTHVVVHGDRSDADPAADLTARRAASVLNYLVTQSVPPARLRAEGRAARDPATREAEGAATNRRVELIVKPIIAGQEAQAWQPPPPSGCGGCEPNG